MAKIHEEQILIQLSVLIRDEETVANGTVATEAIRANIEVAAQAILEASNTLGSPILVEADVLQPIIEFPFVGNV
jgi:hypothetical protein